MLPKKMDSWDVKYLRTIVPIDSEANILTEVSEENQLERPYSMDFFLKNNISYHSAVPWPTESTVDWSLITNNISENLSLYRVVI